MQDIVKIDLQEVQFGGIDWTDLGQGGVRRRSFVNAVMNLRGP